MNEDADVQISEKMEFDKIDSDHVFIEEVTDKNGKPIYKNHYKNAEGFTIMYQEVLVSDEELQVFLQERLHLRLLYL